MKINLRDMTFSKSSVATLHQVALVPEVQKSLMRWVRSMSDDIKNCVLIGGLAMSFYAKPRATTDVDFLFLHKDSIPESVLNFKKHRAGAFEDTNTGVEIEVPTPLSINLPKHIAKKVFDTAIDIQGVKVASFEAMIVLKLFGSDNPKRFYSDLGDIERMLPFNIDVDLSDWYLSQDHQIKLENIRKALK